MIPKGEYLATKGNGWSDFSLEMQINVPEITMSLKLKIILRASYQGKMCICFT